MPVILIQRMPLPSLKTYTAVSVALLACALYYAHSCATMVDEPDPEPTAADLEQDPPPMPNEPLYDMDPNDQTVMEKVTYIHAHKYEALRYIKEDSAINFTEVLFGPSFGKNGTEGEANSYGVRVAAVLLSETWCIWSLVNMACCCLILFGQAVQKIVFGELRVSEQQHLRDKFWNFAFYKFIFIFGVMNVQSMEEVVLWSSWFSVLAFLHLLAQLCKDRFEYLSFSPATPGRTHVKVLLLLIGIQTTCAALLVTCVFVGYMFVGFNIFAFMAAEVFLLMIKTLYVMVRYAIHLYDLHHDSVWENRSVYIYYSELVFELIAISVDFCNHLHMLLWSNIFLSMASLVICMQLRYLFHELQRRIRRHKNYLRVVTTMDEKFKMATAEDLEQNNDDCAICWEKMQTARKLPCGHLFHNACLRSWLEQDTSCPICRKSLTELQPPGAHARPHPPPNVAGDVPPVVNLQQRPPLNQNMTNHFFHFDASRYVSWLPSFSVEVSHTQILGNRLNAAPHLQTSQLDNMARQVQEVFPNIPLATALNDLQMTRSVELTIENIVEGRLVAPSTFPAHGDLQDSDGDSSDSESDSCSSESSTSSPSTSTVWRHDGVDDDVTTGGLYDALPPSAAASLNFVVDESLPRASSFVSFLPNDSVSLSGTRDSGIDNSDNTTSASLPTPPTQPEEFSFLSGCRFSKSPSEREQMLEQRKESMIEQARRKYLLNDRTVGSSQSESSIIGGGVAGSSTLRQVPSGLLASASFSESSSDSDSGGLARSSALPRADSDIALRRERAFLAAQRRMMRE